MSIILIVLVMLVLFALASTIAVYSYGRFANRARGDPSFAMPVLESGTPLDDLVAPLLQPRPEQSGLVLLSSNLDAFATRALAARHAGRSLDLQYYIWKDDLTGRLLINEIVQAADRGVRVRLLLDDINARGTDHTLVALDAHPNIAVRLFNPSRSREGALRRGIEMMLRAFSATRRMHNKAWIADGRLAMIGGRNIGDAYFDASRNSNFRDLDMLLMGGAVAQTEAVFDRFWNSGAAIPIAALRGSHGGGLTRVRDKIARLPPAQEAQPYLRRVTANSTVRGILSHAEGIHWTHEARIVSDPPEKAQGVAQEGWLMHAIQSALLAAKDDLEIISHYFIPGEAGLLQLLDIARAGVKISILTNSLAATDVTAVHGAYARYRKPLVEGGVHLFELKPYDHRSKASLFGSSGASLHTKAFMVDGHMAFVGSMNFDPRSISLNTEMGILFGHKGLIGEVRTIFAEETSSAASYRLHVEDGRIVWQDGAKGSGQTLRAEPDAGLRRRIAATIIGLLPIESQL